jgi:rhamnosyltransferase
MSDDRVCAVVVHYHPNANNLGDLRNLHRLAGEFQHFVVVDNGSAVEPLAHLRETVAETGANLIEVGANLGIATGFNLGLDWALQHGFEFAVLLDQDSFMVPGFRSAILEHYDAAPEREKPAIVSSVHVDRTYGTEIKARPGPGGNPITISSGSLVPLAIYLKHGALMDSFFLDLVDTEYCLRLVKVGRRIDICDRACLIHSIGNPRRVRLFGWTLFTLTNHGPNNRYYSVRNRIWIIRRYFNTFPGFSLVMAKSIGYDVIKIIVGERQKGKKLSRMLRGVVDGLRGRGGPYTR